MRELARIPDAFRVATLLALLLVPGSALAQGLTGSVDGTVKDDTGGVLPGVSVRLTSPTQGGAQERVTDETGAYRFAVLPPGTYVITYTLAGFRSVERTGVVVRPDRTVTIDQVLAPASVAEEVTVVADTPVVDVRNTQVATTVDSAVIEQTPVSRRFTDLLNVMPGVQNGLYTFSPINAVNGSRVTDNVYSVDGVNFNDPQVQAPVTDIAYDDIQEVQVSTSGQFAEFGSASGGVFNFITKSGSNQFRGLGAFYYQSKDLTSDNIDDDLAQIGIRPSLVDHLYDGGGNLGGPILRDRLFFFGSYYKLSQDQSYSDFPVPIPTRQWQATGKADAQLRGSQRAGVFVTYRDRTWVPFNFGFATAQDPRTWVGIGWKNWLTGLSYTATPTSTTVLQVRGGIALFDLINFEPNVEPGTPVYTETTSGVITGGPTQTAGVAQRDRYELKADVARFVRNFGGSHSLKAGVAYEALRMDTERRDQAQGNYLRHQLLNGQPYRVQLLSGPGHALTQIDHWATYLQDQWAVNSRVTVNAGIRWDHWNGGLGPDTYQGGPWFEDETTPEQEGIIPLDNVAARLGLAWDVRGDRRWAIKAGYGRFYQRIAGTDIGVARQSRQGTLTYDWIDRNGDRVFQTGETGTLRGDSRPVAFGRIDEDAKMPYTDAFNLATDVQISPNIGLSVTATIKRERDFRSTINLSLPFDQAYAPVEVRNPESGEPFTIYSIRPAFQGRQPENVLTNPNDPVELYNNYDGLEFLLRRKYAHGWSMQASYNVGRSHGSVGTLFFDTQGNPYSSPQNLVFIEGDQKLDRRHIVKVNAIHDLPYGFQLSGIYQFLSGLPLMTTGSGGAGVTGAYYYNFTRTEYPQIVTSAQITSPIEPQGSRRHDAQQFLDLRLQRKTSLGRTFMLDTMLDVFNVFNANTVTRVETLNLSLTNFLRPAELMQPRAARLAIRLTF